MLSNEITLNSVVFVKQSIAGQKSTFNVVTDPRKTIQCSTETTKAGVQRTVLKLMGDTPTTRYAGSGDSITGRAPVTVALTMSFPKSQDDVTELDSLIADLTAALADTSLIASLKNGEA